MTIDEAIEKHRKIAETQMALYDACTLKEYNSHFLREAEEHEQFAEWLELLKWYEQGMGDIPCESGVLPKDVYWAGYSKAENDYHAQSEKDRQSSYDCGYEVGYGKAIDDFVEKIQWEYENGCGITQRQIYFLKAVSNQVAEQLKEGVSNENS